MKNLDITLAQDNALTQAKYNYTMVEKRAVYFIIKEVRRRFVEQKDGQKDLFSDLVIKMNTEDLQASESTLRDVYLALKSLRKKSIWIEDENKVLEVGYINYFEHQKKESFLEVQVSNKILPYLVELAEQFTAYSLTVAISLKTKYAQRFYEYCSQFASTGFFIVSIKDLREKMILNNSYDRYATMKKKVIDSAQKELKEAYDAGQCDLYFDYSEVKAGRTTTHIKVSIHTRVPVSQILKPEDQVYHIRVWLSNWLNASKRPKNKAWIDGVISFLHKDPNLIPKLFNRLQKLMKDEPNANHAALARHLIEEDFITL